MKSPTLALSISILCLTLMLPASPASGQEQITLNVGRGPITVYAPRGYAPSEPLPLVILLHGYGSFGQQQEGYMRFLPRVDEVGFIYAFPDGTRDATGERFWNATDACCDFLRTGVDDSAYLRGLIERIRERLPVDEKRIFLVGHSNGGFMAYRMACDHAGLIAGIASLAGATYLDAADCTPAAPVRVLQIHGTSDSTIRYEGGSTLVRYPGAVATVEQWARYNGCRMRTDTAPPIDLDTRLGGAETTVTHYQRGCRRGASANLWTIQNGAHIPRLSSDFSRLVLDFFLGAEDGGDGGDDGTDCRWEPGDRRYCRDCGPCRDGEGGCRRDSECRDELVCTANVGADYGFTPETDVCTQPSNGGGGGGGSTCPWELGDRRYCRDCGPCRVGEGGCRRDDQCRNNLVCLDDAGADYGFEADVGVCVRP